MIVKKRGENIVEPMSKAILQIARTAQDRLIWYLDDPQIKYTIKVRDCGYQYCQSSIAIHTYYAVMPNKVFIEYHISKQLHVFLLKWWEDFINYIEGTLKAMYYEDSIHTWSEIVLPEDKYNNITGVRMDINDNCDTNNIITPKTISYWQDFFGKYQLLEDGSFCKNYMDGYMIEHPKFDKNIYYRELYDINKRYGLEVDTHYNIPDAFREYRDLFLEYFGRDLDRGVYERKTYEVNLESGEVEEKLHRALRNPENYVYINFIIPAEYNTIDPSL